MVLGSISLLLGLGGPLGGSDGSGSSGLSAELLPLGRRLEARFLGVQTSGTLLCVLLVHLVHGSLGLDASDGESSLELVAPGARGELGLSLGDGGIGLPEVGGVLLGKLV